MFFTGNLNRDHYIIDLVRSLRQFGNGKWKVKKEDPDWQEIYEKRKIYSFTPRQYRERNFPVPIT